MSITLSSMRIAVATVFFSLAWSIWPSCRCWARLTEPRFLEPGHAHELRLAIDFGRARSAFPCLAVPSDSQVVRLLCLDLVHRIQDDHAVVRLGGEVLERTCTIRTAPDAERARAVTDGGILGGLGGGVRVNGTRRRRAAGMRGRHDCISVTIASRSAGIGGIGARSSCIAPSAPSRTTWLKAPNAGSLSG